MLSSTDQQIVEDYRAARAHLKRVIENLNDSTLEGVIVGPLVSIRSGLQLILDMAHQQTRNYIGRASEFDLAMQEAK